MSQARKRIMYARAQYFFNNYQFERALVEGAALIRHHGTRSVYVYGDGSAVISERIGPMGVQEFTRAQIQARYKFARKYRK